MAIEMTNHEKAIWNAKSTGIRSIAPILTEIYDKQSALEKRIAELEAQLTVGQVEDALQAKLEKNQKNS